MLFSSTSRTVMNEKDTPNQTIDHEARDKQEAFLPSHTMYQARIHRSLLQLQLPRMSINKLVRGSSHEQHSPEPHCTLYQIGSFPTTQDPTSTHECCEDLSDTRFEPLSPQKKENIHLTFSLPLLTIIPTSYLLYFRLRFENEHFR